MSKLDQLRALRETKTAKVARLRASKPKSVAKPPKTAKARPTPNGGFYIPDTKILAVAVPKSAMAELAGGPSCPTCGRFWRKGSGSFDRKAYMRDYMAARRKKTAPETTG